MRARRQRACALCGICCKGFVKKCYVKRKMLRIYYVLHRMVPVYMAGSHVCIVNRNRFCTHDQEIVLFAQDGAGLHGRVAGNGIISQGNNVQEVRWTSGRMGPRCSGFNNHEIRDFGFGLKVGFRVRVRVKGQCQGQGLGLGIRFRVRVMR